MQEGFDIGFHRGVMIGRACGELYGTCRMSLQSSYPASSTISSTPDEALKEVERLLFEELPHMDGDIETTWIDELRHAVLAIAVDLEPKFHRFMQQIEEFGNGSTTLPPLTTTNTS